MRVMYMTGSPRKTSGQFHDFSLLNTISNLLKSAQFHLLWVDLLSFNHQQGSE